MTEEQVLQLFKCLADRSRLRILQSLLQEDMYAERLAQRLGVTPATVSFHMKKLEENGLVSSRPDQYYTMYTLEKGLFMTSMLDLIQEESDEAELQRQRDEAYRQKVLNSFFVYGKLKSIPTQKKKERIVLEEIVKAFEPGRDYTEREVNIILADFHDDFCTLRRDMIGEGLMSREHQVYRRTEQA